MEHRKKAAKVLLNCMPPAQVMMPSISLNILKSVLKQNGFASEIVYWNIIFEPLLSQWLELTGEENPEQTKLLPFAYLQTGLYDDERAREEIRELLTTLYKNNASKAKRRRPGTFITKLPDITNDQLNALIRNVIAGVDFSDVILTGFSAKFMQWLPALPVIAETRRKHPEIKTVIGGFESKDSATEMLRNFSCFDFAVWGEGEYPLLELSHIIKENSANYSQIAGLVYRDGERIRISEKKGRRYLGFDNYPAPDYDDYFAVAQQDEKNNKFFFFPVESSRGCFWNKCNFCVLNQGYRYRERDAESLLSEIGTAIEKYKVHYFQFMDNNIMGSDRLRLDDMLEKLRTFFRDSEQDFSLIAELIPHGMDAEFYKKLALAGFRMVQIGGESFADPLLRKMNKKNSFSDNLLAYKCCLKYGIMPFGANIMTCIPSETKEDVRTCIDNIPFLRFFIGFQRIQFDESPFALEKLSKFYRQMDDPEKEKYDAHFLHDYLPVAMTRKMSRFDLFHFCRHKTPARKILWEEFFCTLKEYSRARFTYKIYDAGDYVQFEGFAKGVKAESFIFDRPAQWQILVNANRSLVSFYEMLAQLQTSFGKIDPEDLRTMMTELKKNFFLYYDENFDKIISVIDTDCLL